MRRLLYVLIGTFLFAAGTAQAQVDRASLTGTVKDSSGAVVPGATVTVTGPQAPSVTTTNGEGTYLLLSLIPGRYVVSAELSGFQKSSRNVILEIGQKGRVDFTLGVGGASETVVVDAPVRLLNTEQSSLGTVMDQGKVANLPLAIRNWDDLLALVPGVQGDRFTEQGGGTSFGRTGGVNVHGTRSLQQNFLLDGVDNNSISENVQELTSQVSRPSVDSIQEFKVVTSPYSAEYGRVAGRRHQRHHEVGHQPVPRHPVRLLPERLLRRERLLLEAGGRGQALQRPEPVRREPRRAAHEGQGLLLRRLRGDPHHPRRHPHHERADPRPAARRVRLHGHP